MQKTRTLSGKDMIWQGLRISPGRESLHVLALTSVRYEITYHTFHEVIKKQAEPLGVSVFSFDDESPLPT